MTGARSCDRRDYIQYSHPNRELPVWTHLAPCRAASLLRRHSARLVTAGSAAQVPPQEACPAQATGRLAAEAQPTPIPVALRPTR